MQEVKLQSNQLTLQVEGEAYTCQCYTLNLEPSHSDLAYTFHCQVLDFSVVAGFLLITEIKGEKPSNT